MNQQAPRAFDVIVVGAGFSGLYLLYRLRKMGFSTVVLEAGSDVGGTWYWNRYPGARCDVESMEYSYGFDKQLEQEWNWTERYPAQPEILSYLQHVADRFDLRRDIHFHTRVKSARWQEETGTWKVRTESGDTLQAAFCIMATGCLSTPRLPPFKGIESFQGQWYHTAQWPKEGVDFTGQRVGVIGTGSTGIQAIPKIAEQASQLFVFQRTPNFSIPAHNGPIDQSFQRSLKARYPEHRAAARASFFGVPVEMTADSALAMPPEERQKRLEAAWQYGGPTRTLQAFADLLVTEEANATAADFVRGKIREIVKDPAVADLLCPTDHPIGTKRICVDTHYYATYNRPNVTLVDVRKAPIVEITPKGLRTEAGDYELDSLVFATGFDAMTGALLGIEIEGRDGLTLQDKWSSGPSAYLGLASAGFPNLFMMTGPGSPSVLSNMVVSIEQHVEWVTDAMAYLREHGLKSIEADAAAETDWMRHVTEVADTTLFPKANSWYVGANIPGKPRMFMPYVGGVGPYRDHCQGIADRGYEGFVLEPDGPQGKVQRAV
ncbi:MAG: flavin-containing monooxygenase [Steroidobacteraceae bacterium]